MHGQNALKKNIRISIAVNLMDTRPEQEESSNHKILPGDDQQYFQNLRVKRQKYDCTIILFFFFFLNVRQLFITTYLLASRPLLVSSDQGIYDFINI